VQRSGVSLFLFFLSRANVKAYFKTTDVQRTWKRHGWIPPSQLPSQQAKWEYFRRLDTEKGTL
jgi:hypothetical protein